MLVDLICGYSVGPRRLGVIWSAICSYVRSGNTAAAVHASDIDTSINTVRAGLGYKF